MEPTLQAWRELYDEAIKIKKQKPWQWMDAGQLFAIEDPQSGVNYYCSVQSSDDVDLVQMFIGEDGLNRVMSLTEKIDEDDLLYAEEYPTWAAYMLSYDEASLSCSFVNKEDLIGYEQRLLERLELSFRGKKQWISFKEMQPGLVAQAVHTVERVRLMQTLLTQVRKICSMEEKDPFLGNLFTDPKLKEIFWWRYNAEKNRWCGQWIKLESILNGSPRIIYPNELELHKMRRLRGSQNMYELLRLYLPAPMEHHGLMCYPLAYILVDLHDGHIAWNHLDTTEANHEQRFLAKLIQFFQQSGKKPSRMVTADFVLYNTIADFCEKTKIFLDYLEYTIAGDDVLESFLDFTRLQFSGVPTMDDEGTLLNALLDDMTETETPPEKPRKDSKIIDFRTGKPL